MWARRAACARSRQRYRYEDYAGSALCCVAQAHGGRKQGRQGVRRRAPRRTHGKETECAERRTETSLRIVENLGESFKTWPSVGHTGLTSSGSPSLPFLWTFLLPPLTPWSTWCLDVWSRWWPLPLWPGWPGWWPSPLAFPWPSPAGLCLPEGFLYPDRLRASACGVGLCQDGESKRRARHGVLFAWEGDARTPSSTRRDQCARCRRCASANVRVGTPTAGLHDRQARGPAASCSQGPNRAAQHTSHIAIARRELQAQREDVARARGALCGDVKCWSCWLRTTQAQVVQRWSGAHERSSDDLSVQSAPAIALQRREPPGRALDCERSSRQSVAP